MTVAIKNSSESNTAGTSSQISENNCGGQSQRSNPVCLEVNVTLRSQPGEAGGASPAIREEGKTVIVFENGAVLRLANNLPLGRTVILSNPSGREVLCRAVSGRKLPNVKGYVEVEFIEPVKDFWGTQQKNIETVAIAPPPLSPLSSRETPAPPTPSCAAVPLETPVKPTSVTLGRGPTFEDIPGLASTPPSNAVRESKIQSTRPVPEKSRMDDAGYSRSEIAESTSSVGGWRPPGSQPSTEKRTFTAMNQTSSTISPPQPRDFMSKGLLGYEEPGSSSSASSGRMPLILGLAALILAGVSAAVFYIRQGGAGVSIGKSAVVSQPSMAEPSPTAKDAPEPARTVHEELAAAATQTQPQKNTELESAAVDRTQSAGPSEAVPAVVTSPGSQVTRTNGANLRKQEETPAALKQPAPSSIRRPVIPNLKMSSPSAPNRNPANLAPGAAPVTEIASTEAGGEMPPAGLLTSSGRTNNPPAPPPSAPAPAPALTTGAGTVRDAKVISSTRLVYPTAARQSHVEGIVTIFANIDASGNVVGATAVKGPMLLRQAAVDSVRQWKYSPALLDGKPAPSQVKVSVEFRLN